MQLKMNRSPVGHCLVPTVPPPLPPEGPVRRTPPPPLGFSVTGASWLAGQGEGGKRERDGTSGHVKKMSPINKLEGLLYFKGTHEGIITPSSGCHWRGGNHNL